MLIERSAIHPARTTHLPRLQEETDDKHGFSTQLRVGAVRWLRRWLLHINDAITEPESPVLSEKEAQVTPKGQVVEPLDANGKTLTNP